jgi:hypothetical protein
MSVELMRLKHAIQAVRQRTLADLDAIEALIDRHLPEPKPEPRLPAGREARKRYYKDKRK